MKKFILKTIMLFMSISILGQNIQLQPTTAVGAVDNLVAGGINPTGQTFTTNPNTQLKLFTNGMAGVGFDAGVVLSTANLGNNPNALGPGQGLNGAGTPGTNLFQQAGITNATTNNAAVLTFTFVPLGDVINFNYVFASNEYNTYVNTAFNDVFAFLLTGPNPQGGNYNNTNIAIVPGTTNTPVSINTVNNGQSGFFNNCSNGPCTNCQFFVDNCNNQVPLALGGRTVPLTATANVIPCETYTIRLAVADVSDGSFNSVVFLEANSFSSPQLVGNQNPLNGVSNSGGGIWESCGSTTVCFTRNYAISQGKWFLIEKGGTAIEGIDYVEIPDSIFISPGDSTFCIDIDLLWNLNSPDNKTLEIRIVDEVCLDFPLEAVVTINILNVEPLTLLIGDFTTGCPTDTINLIPQFSGGAGDLGFLWSTGDITPNISFFNNIPDIYNLNLTIVDECGMDISENSTITVLNGVTANFTFNNVCQGEKITFLNSSQTDTGEELTYIWNINGNVTNIENPSFTFGQSGEYQVQLISFYQKDGIVCSDTLDSLFIIYPIPNADFYSLNGDLSLLNNKTNFEQFDITNTQTWNWTIEDSLITGTNITPIITITNVGIFEVTLIATSEWGCFDIVTKRWIIDPIELVWIPNAFTPNGDSFNNTFKIKSLFHSEVDIKIWNRWGELVFQTNDIEMGWDGRYRGVDCKQDVYVYQIGVLDIWGKWRDYRGMVNLIR
jgi:gliding motility-associated-like protein